MDGAGASPARPFPSVTLETPLKGVAICSDLEQETIQPRRMMAQGSGAKEKRRTTQLAQTLPRGIKIGCREGRPKPFFVRYGNPRKTESFAGEGNRNDRAAELMRDLSEHGEFAFRFDPKEWAEFKAWKKNKTTPSGLLVGQAIGEYLNGRAGEGLAEDSIRHTKTNLLRFVEMFGALPLTDITKEHVKEWMDGLKERGFGPATIRHHRKDLNVFFNRAVERHHWVDRNPCKAIPPPKLDNKEEIAVMALRDAFMFFKANRGQRSVGKLALEAFAGLRCSSAGRLSKEDLDFAESGIVLPGPKHKSGRRHYVDGFPRNLWKWLKHAPEDCWSLTPRNYAQHKALAFARANVKNPGNVFRHTFATMHLAAFKDAPALAILLTHRNITMLYAHYRGRGVAQRIAKAYFKITPKTVNLSWERFSVLVGIETTTNHA
jgi:integrase